MRAVTIALLLGWGFLAAPAPASTLLYDVDFEGPEHVVGASPTLDTGPFPRSGPSFQSTGGADPSRIATGSAPFPTGTQVLRFENDLPFLSSTELSSFGLPERIVAVDLPCLDSQPPIECIATDPDLIRYELSFDVAFPALGTFSGEPDAFHVFADFGAWPAGTDLIPFELRRVSFLADGSVTAFATGGVEVAIGSFSLGSILHVDVTVDYDLGEWIVVVDDDELHRGALGSPNLDAFRFTSDFPTDESVALVDDVQITVAPEPGRALLALAIAAAATLRGRGSRGARTPG